MNKVYVWFVDADDKLMRQEGRRESLKYSPGDAEVHVRLHTSTADVVQEADG